MASLRDLLFWLDSTDGAVGGASENMGVGNGSGGACAFPINAPIDFAV